MIKQNRERLIFLLYLADIALSVISLRLAYILRTYIAGSNEGIIVPPPILYFVVLTVWSAMFLFLDVYSLRREKPFWKEIGVITSGITLCFFMFAGFVFFFKIDGFSRLLSGCFWGINILFMFLWRLILTVGARVIRARGLNIKSVLIVGAGPLGNLVARSLMKNKWLGFKLYGFIDDNPDKIGKTKYNVPILGNIEDTFEICRKEDIDVVIFTLPAWAEEKIGKLLFRLKVLNIEIKIVPDFFGIMTLNTTVDSIEGIPVIGLAEPTLSSTMGIVKRAFDVVFSIIVLIFLSPVFLIISIAIWLESPGPVFYSQKRVGKNGKIFDFYKFRSMVMNADEVKQQLIDQGLNEADGPVFKMKDDPRITKVGKFIRKYSLDEFPQFFNVFKGDMSIVGPRPPVPREVEEYGEKEWRRLYFKPGLTCIWQVSGRSDITFDKWVEMDIEYIENWSLWLDIKLIAKTIPAVLFGKGAY